MAPYDKAAKRLEDRRRDADPSWPEPCDVLVIGSSVACGRAAYRSQGWVQKLKAELGPEFKFVNEAIPGSNTAVAKLSMAAGLLRWKPKNVIVTLSLGNEGLKRVKEKKESAEKDAKELADCFLNGIRELVNQAKAVGASVILGSVYPNSNYTTVHYAELRRAHEVMKRMDMAAFIDFLSVLDDGSGRWRPGEHADQGHPNSAGHAIMFEAARPLVGLLQQSCARQAALSRDEPQSAQQMRPSCEGSSGESQAWPNVQGSTLILSIVALAAGSFLLAAVRLQR